MSPEHVGADGHVRRVHAPGGAQSVVGVKGARRLRGNVGVVELVDRDVGESDSRHAGLGARRELESSRDPRAVRGARGGEVNVVFPRVPFRFFGPPDALRIDDQQSSSASDAVPLASLVTMPL
jgi:hypothetical protein